MTFEEYDQSPIPWSPQSGDLRHFVWTVARFRWLTTAVSNSMLTAEVFRNLGQEYVADLARFIGADPGDLVRYLDRVVPSSPAAGPESTPVEEGHPNG